jgi:hypothetical protein
MAMRARVTRGRERRKGEGTEGRQEEGMGQVGRGQALLVLNAVGARMSTPTPGLGVHVAAMDRPRWAVAGRISVTVKFWPSRKFLVKMQIKTVLHYSSKTVQIQQKLSIHQIFRIS